jgi:H+/Cl- antiporter ClcA
MQNIFNKFNKIGINIIPDSLSEPSLKDQSSPFLLILSAAFISLLTAAFTTAGIWLINKLNDTFDFPFYFPVIATVSWFIIYRLSGIFNFMGANIAIGCGAPFGLETAGFFFSKTIAGKKHADLLYYCGVCSVIAAAFGAPLAALCFALELWLLEWTLIPVTALLISSIIGGGFNRFVQGGDPLFKMTLPTGSFTWSVYAAIGVIIGMWAALTVNLTRLTTRGLKFLISKNYLWLLVPAIIITFIYYYSPSRINNTYGYLDALLNARITLLLLFSLAILKWFSWILYNSFFKTGTGIVPLALSGGALALFAGLVLQLIFSSLKIDTGMVVLIGMAAMLAGTSRALMAAVVFTLEVTHVWEIAFPLILACIISYIVSYLLIRKKHKSNDITLVL